MQAAICARCRRNPAVIFITKIDDGHTSQEGICIKCARELNIKPAEDMFRKLGLTDDDLEILNEETLNTMGSVDSFNDSSDSEDNVDDSKTVMFPFLSRLFDSPDEDKIKERSKFMRERMMAKHNTKYINLAIQNGAEKAMLVTPDDIVFDGRTLLKCMFGCNSWGIGLTCPSRPGALKPWEYETLLRKYKYVLIIHAHDKHMSQNASYEVERAAFLDGDALAFSMSDCALCEECAGVIGEKCRNPKKARPAFHSVGIDVFSTVHKLGLPLATLKSEDEPQNWYSAVWLNKVICDGGNKTNEKPLMDVSTASNYIFGRHNGKSSFIDYMKRNTEVMESNFAECGLKVSSFNYDSNNIRKSLKLIVELTPVEGWNLPYESHTLVFTLYDENDCICARDTANFWGKDFNGIWSKTLHIYSDNVAIAKRARITIER